MSSRPRALRAPTTARLQVLAPKLDHIYRQRRLHGTELGYHSVRRDSLICGWLFVRMRMLGTLGALVVTRARPRACRYLDHNKITSIASGAFTSQNRLNRLYV